MSTLLQKLGVIASEFSQAQTPGHVLRISILLFACFSCFEIYIMLAGEVLKIARQLLSPEAGFVRPKIYMHHLIDYPVLQTRNTSLESFDC